MPHDITCLRCQHALHVAENNPSPSLTCPRCLAMVVNPRALVRTDLPAVATRPEAGGGEPTCPSCGKMVERDWRRCPYCEKPIRRPSPGPRESLDDEVRRDSRGGITAAVVLGVLLVVGVVVFLAGGGGKLVAASEEGPAVFGIGLLVLGAILAGTIAVVATSKDRAVTAVTGVVGGVLVGAGIVVLLVVLFCLGILQTCSDCAAGRIH